MGKLFEVSTSKNIQLELSSVGTLDSGTFNDFNSEQHLTLTLISNNYYLFIFYLFIRPLMFIFISFFMKKF